MCHLGELSTGKEDWLVDLDGHVESGDYEELVLSAMVQHVVLARRGCAHVSVDHVHGHRDSFPVELASINNIVTPIHYFLTIVGCDPLADIIILRGGLLFMLLGAVTVGLEVVMTGICGTLLFEHY